MKQFLLQLRTPKSGVFNLLIKFNEVGELIFVELRSFTIEMNRNQRSWLWNWIPKHVDDLEGIKGHKAVTVTEIQDDLSFESFWELYDYKVGNKKRAKAHWVKLDDSTRALALKKVKEYKFWLAHQTIGKVFAERWLAQKRYENEYRV